MDSVLQKSLSDLIAFIEEEEYKGFDPYDILNSPLPFHLLGKTGQSVAIQLGKRIPYNYRPFVGIKKEFNPKGIGLMLHAFSLLDKNNSTADYKKKINILFKLLKDLRTQGSINYCWGYNFRWVNPIKSLPKYYPSVVVTSFIIKGVYEYYLTTKDEDVVDIIKSASNYVLNDLPVTENEYGICFSYTDVIKDTCFNASLLGAEILAIMYSITGDVLYLDKVKKAVDFVIAYQKEDGRWNYSIDLETNKEDEQIDFHQGFVIESIRNIIALTKLKDPKYESALFKGVEFYINEQLWMGKIMKYRWPKIFPIDIHNQAQAIITFSNLADYDETYLKYAENIILWTIENMQDPKKGCFHYRKGKFCMNKVPFMRWGQAWMLLAIASYLSKIKV